MHIDPKNKGKFTASAKRAGMSVQEFAKHVLANKDKYSTLQVRRANFSRNTKKFKHQEGGILSTLLYPIRKIFEYGAKNIERPQAKSVSEMWTDLVDGNPSFYTQKTLDGGNEVESYLYGTPYNSDFTGDKTLGPSYTRYIAKHFADKKIPTYNSKFADTLYIDKRAIPQIERHIVNKETVGGSMGRYAHGASYIVNHDPNPDPNHGPRRPYDAGGHLMKFTKDSDGQVYAHMADIYDFLPSDFSEKYDQEQTPIHKALISTIHKIGTPFIVRQNNVPVVFKEIVPEYTTALQQKLGDFLSQWGNYYDLNAVKTIPDQEIESAFRSGDYGDDILNYLDKKGYLKRNK